MNRDLELKALLQKIDHRGYPAYKDTRGMYRFSRYVLSIDHVQGDPFAAPSKLSVHLEEKEHGFSRELFSTKERRIALQDLLLRRFSKKLSDYSFKAKGSGKSGLMSVSRPGQEILNRSACQIEEKTGKLILRFEVGFPANGRTVNSRELEKVLFDFLPLCVKDSLQKTAWKDAELTENANLADDQSYLRKELGKRNLVAFVANNAILPRKSGVSNLPLEKAVAFTSPKSLEVTMDLPHKGSLTGMGIPKGVTLITGGGYHGKSTLLQALERGVYNHIKGDGREYVIVDDTGMKIRAEDGRSIIKEDISLFIRNLPNGKNTVCFSTEDASGSTSQAANVMEAIEAGTGLLLMDEDTCATNFMIRDELMQKVVHRDKEPIIPFLDRVKELYEEEGISTIIVAGSSGAFFHKADLILQMDEYHALDITEMAKEAAKEYPLPVEGTEKFSLKKEAFSRIPQKNAAFKEGERLKMKSMGRDGLLVGKEMIDLRYVEQLVDEEQVHALGEIMVYAQRNLFDQKRTLQSIVEELCRVLEAKGFAGIGADKAGNLALPRKQEILACLNRYRSLRIL